MGSGSSRLGTCPTRPRVPTRHQLSRRRRVLAPFLCGTSRSHSPLDGDDEMEDNLFVVSANSIGQRNFIIDDELQSSVKESSSFLSSENECSSSMSGNSASCSSNGIFMGEHSIECGSQNCSTSDTGKCLAESKELVPYQVDAGNGTKESFWEKNAGVASSSEELPLELAPTNGDIRLETVVETDDSTNEDSSHVCCEGLCSCSIPQQELTRSYEDGSSSVESHTNNIPGANTFGISSMSAVPDSSSSSEFLREELLQEGTSPSLGSLRPTARQNDRRNESVLHVDVVSITSDMLPSSTEEITNHDGRQNSRRLFWDAFSRRSSRRNSDSTTIVFSTEDTDDVGSHDRWLLDFSGDLFDNRTGDVGNRSSRNHSLHERRWHSRSEIWERLRVNLDERRGGTAFCASGIHPDGTCSCGTFLMSESGTRASISRIVMLAEALFEVLDEIHRQPISLSLSMVSLPAPESVVDSFPIKNHKKHKIPESGDDVEQCYICLAEYEEEDKIRVLPCRHEYHMSCVDKWLKEIHGVCPLCRGNVCEGASGGSVSGS